MSDYGIKVSQFGYDVTQAADYQIELASSWPLLKIGYQGSFSIASTGVDTTVYTHNLGYVPLCLLIDNTSYASRLFGADTGTIKIDSTKVQVNLSASITTPFTGYLYLFRHNLEQNYQAPIINTSGSVLGSAGDYGIKVTKAGKDFTSTDMRDYVIHSSTRSPMIQNITNGPLASNGTDFTLTVTHSLTYNPWFLSFIKRSGQTYYEGFFGGAGSEYLIASGTTVVMHSTASGHTGSIVVFKDPFQL